MPDSGRKPSEVAARTPLEEVEDEIRAIVRDRERLQCARCRATPEGAVPDPCNQCVTGFLRARIHELQGEFYYDWAIGVFYGRCGHRWRGHDFKDESCPFCELLAKGRPKGLIRRALEAV